jgi:hypothetical protein
MVIRFRTPAHNVLILGRVVKVLDIHTIACPRESLLCLPRVEVGHGARLEFDLFQVVPQVCGEVCGLGIYRRCIAVTR